MFGLLPVENDFIEADFFILSFLVELKDFKLEDFKQLVDGDCLSLDGVLDFFLLIIDGFVCNMSNWFWERVEED